MLVRQRSERRYETGEMRLSRNTPGQIMAMMLADIAQVERDMPSERVRYDLAAAQARGRKLGWQIVTAPNPTGKRLRC